MDSTRRIWTYITVLGLAPFFIYSLTRAAPSLADGHHLQREEGGVADPLAEFEAVERDELLEAQSTKSPDTPSREWILSPGADPTTTVGDAISIQAALDAAETGDTITLLAGTYYVNLYFPRKAITLQGDTATTRDQVVLDGSRCVQGTSECSVFTFDWSNPLGTGSTAMLNGFTLVGGKGRKFSGYGNSSSTFGGGVWSKNADMEIGDVTLSMNSATHQGGGIYLYKSSPSLVHVEFTGNSAAYGGGMYLYLSPTALTDVSISGNYARKGGGMYLETSSNSVSHHLSVSDNHASEQGGGIYIDFSEPAFLNSTVSGNQAYQGGGIFAIDGSSYYPIISHTTLTHNYAEIGGAISVVSAGVILHNSILAFNAGEEGPNIHRSGGSIKLLGSLLWQEDGTHGVEGSTVPSSTRVADPLHYDDPTDGFTLDDDVHPRPTSPVINGGDKSQWDPITGLFGPYTDPDGTAPEIGVYGGVGNTTSDLDQDQAPDEWEEARGLDTGGNFDYDGDTLSDGQEFALGTDPTRVDSDGDHLSDDAEVGQGTNPLDGIDPPRPDSPHTVRVPQDYPSIQEAVKSVRDGAVINVSPGTYIGTTEIWDRNVIIESSSGSSRTILNGDQANSTMVLLVLPKEFMLRGFTITGGKAKYGGGIRMELSQGTLSELVISDNIASEDGGGMSLGSSTPTLSHVRLSHNSAANGGGLYLFTSQALLVNSILSNNIATNQGGGIYLESAYLTASQSTLSQNSATEGGAIYARFSSPDLVYSTLSSNSATNGGGVYLYSSWASLSHLTFSGNTASSRGGGIYIYDSTPSIHNSIITFCTALYGSSIYCFYPYSGYKPKIVNSILYPYWADYSCGVSAPPAPFNQNPLFVNDPSDGTSTDDNYHLQSDSPARDMGATTGCYNFVTGASDTPCSDPDTSLPDPGAWGGPNADEWDKDDDGAPAPWWPVEPDGSAVVTEGYDTSTFDCNDDDTLAHPGAMDIPVDGIDNDCDGLVDETDGGGCHTVPSPEGNLLGLLTMLWMWRRRCSDPRF